MAFFALVFPGQGSQSVGMGGDIIADFKAARLVFEEAEDELHKNIRRLILQGPQEELSKTENTQPAILVLSAAIHAALREAGVGSNNLPAFAAGHSLGEYSALVAAESLSIRQAAGLVGKRAAFMQQAVAEGQGAMAAVIGLSSERLDSVLKEASTADEIVAAANFNAPGQIVISGHRGAVQRAQQGAKEAGARAVIVLKVSVPSHCPLMEGAADNLKRVLAGISFKEPAVPVVSNVTATPYSGADAIADLLAKQLILPVRWEQSVRYMVDNGVTGFIEVGPGAVLSGLIKRIDAQVATLAVGNTASLREAQKKYQ
ncbi:MAG: ACP S-malonyltransferase [Deltaproteobacteria bacterium]|nr:ACP S-malonyltransferase [Candidatus Zymogenaceae bacterium]